VERKKNTCDRKAGPGTTSKEMDLLLLLLLLLLSYLDWIILYGLVLLCCTHLTCLPSSRLYQIIYFLKLNSSTYPSVTLLRLTHWWPAPPRSVDTSAKIHCGLHVWGSSVTVRTSSGAWHKVSWGGDVCGTSVFHRVSEDCDQLYTKRIFCVNRPAAAWYHVSLQPILSHRIAWPNNQMGSKACAKLSNMQDQNKMRFFAMIWWMIKIENQINTWEDKFQRWGALSSHM